jgi:putative transposase
MPRIARLVVPGLPHHITQRGNRRQEVFFSDLDRQCYLQLLLHYSVEAGLLVLAYCLMTNHIHLIAIPALPTTLAKVFKPVHTRYSQHYNRQMHSCGRLWQGRFFSCSMDDYHLWTAIRYVERNPVRAGMVTRAEDYAWSSAAHHSGLLVDPIVSALPEPRPTATGDWAAWLRDPEDDATLNQIRSHTRTGRPFACDDFLADLESRYGTRVRTKTPGRHRKRQILITSRESVFEKSYF